MFHSLQCSHHNGNEIAGDDNIGMNVVLQVAMLIINILINFMADNQ